MWLSQPPNILFHDYPSSFLPLSFTAIPGLGTQVTKRCVDVPPPSDASSYEKWKLLEDFYFPCSFVGHARQYPQPKEKILSGEPGLVQPKMLLVPLNVTPGTQFYWILIANLPNSVRKEGKELPFSTWVLLFTLSGKFRASCLVLPSAFTTS